MFAIKCYNCNMKTALKNDKYKKARGGPSRALEISCATCGKHLLTYQKDGIGSLKRLYVDRIIDPPEKAVHENLSCDNCEAKIGSAYIYEKESREAIILNQGSFAKKLKKL